MKNRTDHLLLDKIDAADPLAVAKFIRNSGKDIFILKNHGVLICGESLAGAFSDAFFLERAARIQIQALQTGQEIDLIGKDLAKEVSAQFCRNCENAKEEAFLHAFTAKYFQNMEDHFDSLNKKTWE